MDAYEPEITKRIREAKQANQVAVTLLANPDYTRLVYEQCFRVLHDASAAAKITRETFKRAYETLSVYPEDVKPSDWLLRIATQLCNTPSFGDWLAQGRSQMDELSLEDIRVRELLRQDKSITIQQIASIL